MENISSAIVLDIEGKLFRADSYEDEPRVQDTQLGEWLGFARPRKIRELIVKLKGDGHLPGIQCRPHTGRIVKTGAKGVSGIENRVIQEFWLTEAEALLVVAKAETPKAMEVLKETIRLWLIARKELTKRASAFERELPEDTVESVLRAHAANPQRYLTSAQVGDNPMFAKELRQKFGHASLVTGFTWRKIEGYVRSVFGVPSYLKLNVTLIDGATRLCNLLIDKKLHIQPNKRELAKMRGERKQLKLWN